jgi:hypothetical protein
MDQTRDHAYNQKATYERILNDMGAENFGTVDSNMDWAPRVPFDEESGLSMWLKENHHNKTSWNKNVTSALDEDDPPVQLCQSGPYFMKDEEGCGKNSRI